MFRMSASKMNKGQGNMGDNLQELPENDWTMMDGDSKSSGMVHNFARTRIPGSAAASETRSG